MEKRRTKSCCVYGCKAASGGRTGLTFHKIPKNPEVRKAWLRNIQRRDWTPSIYSVICSAHFEEKWMDRTGQTVRVREGAVPTIFQTYPLSLQKVQKPRKPPPYRINVGPVQKAIKCASIAPTRDIKPLQDVWNARTAMTSNVLNSPSNATELGQALWNAKYVPVVVLERLPSVNPAAGNTLLMVVPDGIGHNVTEGSADRVTCMASNCFNSQDSYPNMRFFRFPREKNMCQLWLTMCEQDPNIATALRQNTVLCAEHFEDSQFANKEKSQLVLKAVPRLFNGNVREIPSGCEQCFHEDPSYIFDVVKPAAKVSDMLCCVAGCPSKGKDNMEFYNFPKEVSSISKWLKFLADRQEEHVSSSCICENHFDVNCLRINSKGEKVLQKSAVPFDPSIRKPLRNIKNLQESVGTWTCPCCCSRTFRSRQELGAHVAELSRLLRCPSCQKSFSSLELLASHLVETCSELDHLYAKQSDEHHDQSDDFVTHVTMNSFEDETPVGEVLLEQPQSVAEDTLLELPHGLQIPVPDASKLASSSTSSYECEDCNKTFSCRKILLQHRRRKHSIKIAVHCPICSKACSTDASLQTHMSTHRVEIAAHCPTCGKAFPSEGNLRKHVLAKHVAAKHVVASNDATKQTERDESLLCEICGISFSNPTSKKSHVLRHENYKYRCEICEATFTSDKAFRKHVVGHPGQKPYPCPHCPKRFTQRANLKWHQRLHTNYTKHICSYCGKHLRDGFRLRQHEAIHRREFLYYCDNCGKGFFNKDMCNAHKKRVDCLPGRGSRKSTSCTICGAIFDTLVECSLHCRLKHGRGNEGEFPCDSCSKVFKSLGSLYMHRERMHRVDTTTCQYCSATFANKILLARHKEGVHFRKYACALCNRRFGQKTHLRSHFRNHEIGALQRACELCGALFALEDKLAKHVADHADPHKFMGETTIVHPEYAKKYNEDAYRTSTCDVCGKVCKSAFNLYEHSRTHTRPFKCVCGNSFTRNKYLQAHQNKCSALVVTQIEEQVVVD